jgi:hypothetical protein
VSHDAFTPALIRVVPLFVPITFLFPWTSR